MTALPQYNSLNLGLVIAFNTNTFFQNFTAASTTETDKQVKWRIAGICNRLQVVVSANTIATSPTTVRTRVNAGNGNQSVSIPAGSTGSFTDMTNFDSIASGANFNFQIVTPNTSGSITIMQANTLFAASTNSCIKYIERNSSFANTSTTNFCAINGGFLFSTEPLVQTKMKTAGTLQNFFINIVSNTAVDTTTYRTRKNTANGNQVIALSANATGQFEDLSNTDSVAVNDLVATDITTGPVSGVITMGVTSALDFITTTGASTIIQGDAGNLTNAALTRYVRIGMCGWADTTEPTSQALAMVPATLSSMCINIFSNTLTATSTFKFRKNGANGNQTISISAGVTGFLEDASNTDTVIPTDLINYQLITGGTGTSIRVAITSMMMAVNFSNAFPFF